jgi:HlyD family secretion protein
MEKQSHKHIVFAAAAIVIIIAASVYISYGLKQTPKVNFVSAQKADITQGLSLYGTVTAAQDLSLAFENGGTVAAINVKAGDHVKQGQVLVKLDTASASAAVSQVGAALAGAQANYQKLQNGQTSASLNVAQTALDSAQKNLQTVTNQQNQIVQNTLTSLLNSSLTAIPNTGNISTQSPTITGTYTGTQQGQYQIKLYSTGSGVQFEYSGLESGSGKAGSVGPTPLGTFGLSIQFPNGQLYTNDSWTINIPNTDALNYLANLNAYNAALQAQTQAETAAQAAVNSAQAAMALAQTPARPEDIASAQAQMQAAAANLQNAQNALNKSSLIAPIDGVITSVDAKVGETTQGSTLYPGVEVVKMISNEKFQVVVYISEGDVGKIKVGDKANITLDAYGNGSNFSASVISIDPSTTTIGNTTGYKTTLQFDQNDDRIKEGMNANIQIIDQTKQNTLVVPATSVLNAGANPFVLTQNAQGAIQSTPVQTGFWGLDGNVEITSGLNEGQQVAAFGK